MKRNPATAAEQAVRAMLDAGKRQLSPLRHTKLRPQDRPFWRGIVRARARDEWTDANLVVAAQLARCQADIETQQGLLDTEGSILENARGTAVMNPRVTVMEQLARREMALMRTLRMGGELAGDPRDEAARRRVQQQAEAARTEITDDELLAH